MLSQDRSRRIWIRQSNRLGKPTPLNCYTPLLRRKQWMVLAIFILPALAISWIVPAMRERSPIQVSTLRRYMQLKRQPVPVV